MNAPGRTDGGKLPLFLEADDAIGPLSIRRSFDTALPRSFGASAAAGDRDAGVRSFVSWKPPRGDFRGAADGRYDDQVRAWAESIPAGVFATSFHEPENDMTGPEFVALQRHLYGVVKQVNPAIRWGPVYMAYWWDPAEPSHFIGDPAAWWPGEDYADFVGLDWYGPDPEPMTTSGSFRNWFQAMRPTGLPLFITEYGQYAVADGEQRDPAKERARAEAIRQDAAWIADAPADPDVDVLAGGRRPGRLAHARRGRRSAPGARSRRPAAGRRRAWQRGGRGVGPPTNLGARPRRTPRRVRAGGPLRSEPA